MSFRLKTILGIALIELVLLAILIASGIGWLRDSNEQQIIANGERLSNTFAIAVRDAIIATDLANLRAFTQEAIRDGDIAYIRVKDDQRLVLAEASSLTDESPAPNYAQTPTEARDGIYDIRYTVYIDEYPVGEIEIGLDVSAFSQLIDDAKKYAISIAALEMVLVALFSLGFGALLTKQLLALQEGALSIQQNGPGKTVPVRGNDEVAQVANAFNEMSLALSQTYQELSLEKNRYKQLAVQNKMLAEIVEQSHEAYLITDLSGYVSLSNKALDNLFGFRDNEACDKDFQTLLFGENTAEEAAYQLRDAMQLGQSITVRAECLSIDGRAVQTEITAFPIVNNAGVNDRYVLIVRDVHEQLEFEKALKHAADTAHQATRAKSQFLANMSHEIRTPMNGIIGVSEMLRESSLPKEQKEFVDIIYSSAKSLLQLINDILDFSKLEEKKLKLSEETFCLRTMVEETASMVAISASRKELLVVVDIPPDINTLVISDELRLRQVFNNLLGNAVKFTEHGYIRISVRAEPKPGDTSSTYTLTIEDTGIGIPEDKLSDITKAFEQVNSSTSRRYKGTGLGLSITKSLLSLFNSELEVVSEYNKGSRFSFTLTLPTVPTEGTDEGALTARHIAIINADPLHRPIFDRYFTYWQAKHTYLTTVELLEETKTLFDAAVVLIDQDTALYPEPYCPWIGVVSNPHHFNSLSESTGHQIIIIKPIKMRQLLQELQLSMQEEAPLPPPNECAGDKTHHTLDAMSIVVVDDIEYNRDVTKIFLSGVNDHVTYYATGQDVLSHYKKNQFDILVTDISMPDLDGYELTATLRQFEREHDVPPVFIIGLSAHAGREDYDRAVDAGMDIYLTKPVRRADLITALDQAAQKRAPLTKC